MRARADMDWPEHPEGASEVTDDAAASLRLWLVRGSHAFAVNRRRGRGRNGHARQLLVADAGWLPGDHSGWRGLVTALQRHTVLNALAQLHRSDRLILTMAYLQGHTNLEIARMLHVSARTVSRRLSTALARLEENARNAGIWIASVVLVALGFLSRSQERAMGVVRSVQWQQAAVVVAAGTAVAVIGLAASPTEPGAPAQTFAPAGRSRSHRPSPTPRQRRRRRPLCRLRRLRGRPPRRPSPTSPRRRPHPARPLVAARIRPMPRQRCPSGRRRSIPPGRRSPTPPPEAARPPS